MAQSLSGLHLATTWNAAGARPTALLQVSWDGATWTDETSRLLAFEVGATLHTGKGLPFLGEIPLYLEIREGGDRGVPAVVAAPDQPAARAFISIAKSIQQAFA